MMQQLFGSYALAGAIIFLILGLIDYVIVAQFVLPRMEAARLVGRGSGQGTPEQMRSIRSVMIVICFILFPGVGYYIGPRVLPALGL